MRVRHLIVLAAAVFGLLAVFAGGALAQQETIASVTPSSGPVAGGTTVVITGDYIFDAMPRPVTIGGENATFVSQEIVNQGPTAKITVTTPAGTAGPADVVIYAYAGGPELVRKTGGFTYTELSVKSVKENSGLTTGGQAITITGTGFSGGSTPTVTMGGTPATNVTVVNDTTITATTPEHTKGAVDVVVSLDGRQVTASGAYTFNQGYWLAVTTQRPDLSAIGSRTVGDMSPGGIRTWGFGDWTQLDDSPHDTRHLGYVGGINCGERVVFSGYLYENWASGPCRYAFAEGTAVRLSAFASSSILPDLEMYFLSQWGGDCPTSTQGDSCSVTMGADRNVSAAWGFFRSLGTTGGDVVSPLVGDNGAVKYWQFSFRENEEAVGGTPTYRFVAFMVKTATSREHATAVRTGRVACRTSAHISGGRMRATCAGTPLMARALAKGSVRLTTRWYARLPHQTQPVLIRSGHAILRGRRTSAITG